METIALKPLQHHNQNCIGIYCKQQPALNYYYRKAGAKWSKTNKCWHIPCTETRYKLLACCLKGKALLEVNELKQYLSVRKKNAQRTLVNLPETNRLSSLKNTLAVQTIPVQQVQTVKKLSKENNEAMLYFLQQLVLRSYSAATIKTYQNEFRQFLQLIKDKPAKAFTCQRIKDYLQYCHEKLHLSENTLHSRMNALKFYYEQVLNREKFFWDIPRPKRPVQLPKLLNENELARLFNAITNKKHKAILFTAYSAGLRVSEVINLEIKDVDSRRMQIFIQRAKGKKDRYVNLSPLLLDILRQYITLYRPAPKKFLFESEVTGTCYPARTVQQIFSIAKEKAGIRKEVGIHSLRHSFATHLLDKGTDIKYIKELLGHFNIKTTERYLHVSTKQLINVVSPFDDLWKKENIEW